MYWINQAQDISGWSNIAPMDVSRAGLGVAALGGKLYAVGGADAYGSAEVYDPSDNSWTYIASMGVSRQDVGVAALGGKLYAVGGYGSGARLKSAEVYDPMDPSGGWNPIASMDISRSQVGVAALGGKLYAVGGDDGNDYLNSVEVYDPIDNSWTDIASMDVSRAYLGVAALGGRLYAVGGADAFDGSAEVYDPIHNSWADIAPMDISRVNLGVAALGGRLYAVGGGVQRVNNSLESAEVYDPMDPSGGWNPIASMDVSRNKHGVAALGGKLYAVGGQDGDGNALKSVEAYDPSLVQMPQITHQGEDFYISHQRGGPKTFVIPHPEHKGKMLRHACIEAPTRGTNIYEYQFEVTIPNQTTTIALPSYFEHINGRPRIYVNPENVFSTCYGTVNENLTHAIIQTEKPGIFNVMVTGVRKDPDAVKYSASENIDEPIAPKDIPSSQTSS